MPICIVREGYRMLLEWADELLNKILGDGLDRWMDDLTDMTTRAHLVQKM